MAAKLMHMGYIMWLEQQMAKGNIPSGPTPVPTPTPTPSPSPEPEPVPPEPEPIVLPPQTIRFRFENADYDPSVIENGGVWTKVVDSSYNDWDWYCEDTDWESKFDNENGWAFTEDNRTSIIATGDMSNVTSIVYMFYKCTGLTSVPDNSFDNVPNVYGMFYECTGLTSIPYNSFNNNISDVDYMFYGCTRVEHGALALYNKWENTPRIITYNHTFKDCGKDTTTGLAELEQIPYSWR